MTRSGCIVFAVLALVVIAVCGLLLTGVIEFKGPYQRNVARIEVSGLHGAIRQYRLEYGLIPTNWYDDAETILRGLSGNNPRQIQFIVPFRSTEDEAGGFVDPWGRPYLVRIESDGVVVWSSGPNRVDDGGERDDIIERRVLAHPMQDTGG